MTRLSLQTLIQRLGRSRDSDGDNGDAELLARFAANRDEAAFEVLVWRHGPMVLNLCRRMLRHEQNAEDAFQATFLALAREAGRIGRRESLGGWLYRVAFRIALKVRARSGRDTPGPVPERSCPDPANSVESVDLRGVLDEELSRLPSKYRLPFVLCCLEGRSNTEAAREIGCPRGTVDSRLSWAKKRLRERLLRRGVAPAAAALAVESLVATDAPAAVLTADAVRATVESSLAFLCLTGAGTWPAPVALAHGVLRAMFLDRIKRAAVVLLAVALLVGGAGWATFHAQADDKPAVGKAPAPTPDVPKADKPAAPPKAPPAPAKAPARPHAERNQVLRDRMKQVVDMERPIDATLKDVLEFLSDRFDLTIIVDEGSFRNGDPPLENVYETKVSLPKMPGVGLRNLLELTVSKLKENGCTVSIMVKRGQVWIVRTQPGQRVPLGGEHVPAAFAEPVSLSSDEMSFADTIRELIDQTGANIVIDGRAKDIAMKPVAAQLQDAPLLTAVRVLADMVDLKVVTSDNVIYVTTPENAARWKAENAAQDAAPKKLTTEPKKGQ